MNKLRNLLILLFLVTSVNIFSQSKEDALKDAKTISKATLAYDFDTVLKYTLPKALEMMGGKEAAKEILTSTFEGMTTQGFKFEKHEVIGVSDVVKEQNQYRCVVESYGQMVMPGQRIKTKSYLVGIYNDEGKHWWFIEAKQLKNEAIADQLLPGFETALELKDDETEVEPIVD